MEPKFWRVQIKEIGVAKLRNWSFEVLNRILHYAGAQKRTLNQISVEAPDSRVCTK